MTQDYGALYGETTVPAETLESLIRNLTIKQEDTQGFPQTKIRKFKSAIKQARSIIRQNKNKANDNYNISKRQLAFLNRLANAEPNQVTPCDSIFRSGLDYFRRSLY